MRTDFVLCLFMMKLTLGLCSQEPASTRFCIHMTPEKEQQIDKIIDKLGGFLNNLTIEHQHFDIRLIKLAIDQHSEDEIEEKETVLQLSVNDCQNDAAVDNTDHRQEKAGQSDSERDTAKAKSTNGRKPNVMYLELEENGQKLVEVLDKKARRPRLVYVQKDQGQLDYLFYR